MRMWRFACWRRATTRRTAPSASSGRFTSRSLSDLFVQVVKLAREMGLVKLGTIAVDGTKVKANACEECAP